MDIHKPKPWHGLREFLKEYAIIVVGVLTALGAEQGVDWLHWRYEIGDARQALGREIGYNIKALQIMDQQNNCMVARMNVLAAWAAGKGPRPAGLVKVPLTYNLETSAWDVTNAGQVIAHFPLEMKLSYAQLFARFVNERAAIDDERAAWAQVVALANQPRPDAEELRRMREAIGLAGVWESRRHTNSKNMIRIGSPMAVAGPGPILPNRDSEYSVPCAGAPGAGQ